MVVHLRSGGLLHEETIAQLRRFTNLRGYCPNWTVTQIFWIYQGRCFRGGFSRCLSPNLVVFGGRAIQKCCLSQLVCCTMMFSFCLRFTSVIFGSQKQWDRWWLHHSLGPLQGLFIGYGFLRLRQSYTEESGLMKRIFNKYDLHFLLKSLVLIPVSSIGFTVSRVH